MRPFSSLSLLASLLLGLGCVANPTATVAASSLAKRSTPKLVFAHFIVGLVQSYQQSDWQNDMQLAQATGIDGFALNIGFNDAWTDTQLSFAYTVANQIGFKLFISFDFTTLNAGQNATPLITPRLQAYAPNGAQVQWGNGALVSTFSGDGYNWATVRSSVSTPLEIIPNYQAANVNGVSIDGAFNWNGWPSQNNQPINSTMTTGGDLFYQSQLAGKPYMAPVSPWFFTHFGPPPDFNKNWLFLSDTLLIDRWNEILALNPQPNLVELVSWNDFGESHYFGPLHPSNPAVYPGRSAEWVAGFPHDAWRQIMKLYIAAYKNGGGVQNQIQTESIVYWYRPFPKGTPCSDSLPPPTGSSLPADSVWAATILKSPANLTITSPTPLHWTAPAGINYFAAGMGNGNPQFQVTRNGQTILSGSGGLAIQNSNCQTYNFNAYVGSIP